MSFAVSHSKAENLDKQYARLEELLLVHKHMESGFAKTNLQESFLIWTARLLLSLKK